MTSARARAWKTVGLFRQRNKHYSLHKKFVHDARTERVRGRIFHVEQFLNFKDFRINKFDVDGFNRID